MRVAVVSPVWFPVPPTGYGGIELIVHLLVEGLVAQGIDVTLFASGDSRTSAHLAHEFAEAPSDRIGQTYWELRHMVNCLERADAFDLVHDHTGMLGLALGGLLRVPYVHTAHGPLSGVEGDTYARILDLAPTARLISITDVQRRPQPDLPWLATVHNAIDLATHPLHVGDDGYLLFLGRMSPDKGPHRAVEVALETGLPLVLAGKCREPAERAFFDEYVKPQLGGEMEYLGEVSAGEKVHLLQRARALLFPISWDEPFGLVMIEALACGTPVVATRRGSVPEIIEHGITGVVVDDHREMPAALEDAARLDAHRLRASVEERFSPERMVRDYLEAYERALAATV